MKRFIWLIGSVTPGHRVSSTVFSTASRAPSAGCRCGTLPDLVNILLVNWQDRANPHAGGAEIHLFEIFSRLAGQGNRIRLICSGWEGAPARATFEGIEIERHGGRHSFALAGRTAVHRAIDAERPDILVEDINKLPLFLPLGVGVPICAIVPHLFGSTAFAEAPWPMAAAVWAAERPLPRVYRRGGIPPHIQRTPGGLSARGGLPAPGGGIPSRRRKRRAPPGAARRRATPPPLF